MAIQIVLAGTMAAVVLAMTFAALDAIVAVWLLRSTFHRHGRLITPTAVVGALLALCSVFLLAVGVFAATRDEPPAVSPVTPAPGTSV